MISNSKLSRLSSSFNIIAGLIYFVSTYRTKAVPCESYQSVMMWILIILKFNILHLHYSVMPVLNFSEIKNITTAEISSSSFFLHFSTLTSSLSLLELGWYILGCTNFFNLSYDKRGTFGCLATSQVHP